MSPTSTEDFDVQIGKMINLIEKFLPLEEWQFHESSRFASQGLYPTIVFDSEFCRVRFMWDDGYPPRMDPQMLYIHYGRLHAPNNKEALEWMLVKQDGEKYYCWHDIRKFALNFLDGLSPLEAIEAKYKPKVIANFRETDIWKNITSDPERQISTCAVVWEHYKKRLFDLFDLRQPDTWEKYASFISECCMVENKKRNEKGFASPQRTSLLPNEDQIY